MKLIVSLKELKVGDWVKIYPKEKNKSYWKIGEITHKWFEKNEPLFQLKIIGTNLPQITEKIIRRLSHIPKKKKEVVWREKDIVFKLSEKEKDKIIKRNILDELR